MADTKEVTQLTKQLFDRQTELLLQVPADKRDELKLLILLSVQTSLAVMKLVMTTGDLSKANQLITNLESMMTASLPNITVKVRTSVKLTSSQLTKLTTILKTQLGKEIIINQIIDPNILAGIVLEYGEKVIDLTIDEALSGLKRHLLS